jgi:hypothetical protein
MLPQTFDESFERVRQLVSVFKQNERQYLSPTYSEAQARIDFIDKFWIALGWDVNHETQTNPYEQEVKVERGVTMSAGRKRADYAFLTPNFRDVLFYVEAKKPQTDLDSNLNYFQTIRYGWNGRTPLAVLTDFEQFRVLDCRYKPDITTALDRAVKKFSYDDYFNPEKFAELYYLFSREATRNGALEKYVETLERPLGKAHQRTLFGGGFKSIDESFLEDLDAHREQLAQAFSKENPQLDSFELTEIIQRTLDRLVFMRFLEDKLIEPEPIVENLGNTGSAWQDFVTTSHRLNRVYNGIIFKKHALLDSPTFKVDEAAFNDVRLSLAHTISPYDFNAIPIHILGSIYERFLGKIIAVTDEGAEVQEKPEVRKAGGVYYTPEYIVRYIVERTIGKLIRGKAPDEIRQMHFADIACGSGSFLLGIYDLLLRYHTSYYNATKTNKAKGRKAGCIEREDGTLQLSILQRRDILLNNIFGVDVDPQAVEVAQLSLYLKLLEDETIATSKRYQMEFREALLPSLNQNIICGNSLVGWDILGGHLFDPIEERKLNPMDFGSAFPGIMKGKGFDAVVGNPPWGVSYSKLEKDYLRTHYQSIHVRTPESFNYFISRAWQCTNHQGRVGFIIPSSFLNQYEFWKTRKMLVDDTCIERVCNLGDSVFQRVAAPSCLIVFSKKEAECGTFYLDLRTVERSYLPEGLQTEQNAKLAPNLGHESDSFTLQPSNSISIIQKCNRWPKLKEIAEDVATGISSGLDTAYVYTLDQAQQLNLEEDLLRKLVIGGEINRYSLIPNSGKQIIYATPNINIEEYPNCYTTLLPYRDRLLRRREAANGKIPWFSLNWPRRKKLFERPKILIRQTSDRILAAFDTERWYCLKSAIIVQLKENSQMSYEYLLALLNSRLMHFLYIDLVGEQERIFPEVKPVQLFKLPIRFINFEDETDESLYGRIVALVPQMIIAKQQSASAQSDRDKNYFDRKCSEIDRQLDEMIYELYGLTVEEIALVEAD